MVGYAVISHFPSGLKATAVRRIDGKLGHLAAVTDAPNLGAQMMTTRCQPFPVGADGNVTAFVQRSDSGQAF